MRRVHFEGHYFGVEGTKVGTVGAKWVNMGKRVTLSPGMAVYFGERQTTESLRESEESDDVILWDGNHVSVRWRRLDVGPSWERTYTREEDEWEAEAAPPSAFFNIK